MRSLGRSTWAICVALAFVRFVPAADVTFSENPTCTRLGEGSVIRFVASAPCDVAVYVENAKGEVIRHLAAGVLGDNPPPPFKKGLMQEIAWDGKADYGMPAEGGPFKARVGLGMTAQFDRVIYSTLPDLRYVATFATMANGSLYASFGGKRWQPAGSRWRVFSRDGTFQTTCGVPPGSDAARYFGWSAETYRPDPRRYKQTGFETDENMLYDVSTSDAIAINREGTDLFQIGNSTPPCINRYPLTATCAKSDKFRTVVEGFGAKGVLENQGSLAVSSDGKTLFVGGLTRNNGKDVKPESGIPAVFAVNCPERTGFRVFFGNPAKTGNNQDSLGGVPWSIASDAAGHLFVADASNNRVIIIDEKDGKYIGELSANNPVRVACTPSGICYVISQNGKDLSLNRFHVRFGAESRSWKELKSEASLTLGTRTSIGSLAVDASASPLVLWFGGAWNATLRIEDSGAGPQFGTVKDFNKESGLSPSTWNRPANITCGDLSVDRLRKEIYFRAGGNGNFMGRFSESSAVTEFIELKATTQWGGQGIQATPAPNGNIYGLVWSKQFHQWDRTGKPLPWEIPVHADSDWVLDSFRFHNKNFPKEKVPKTAYVPVSMSGLPHMLGVRWSDGHLFVLHPPTTSGGARRSKAMHEYLPTGKWITALDKPIVWKVSDAATGPKFDAAGNIYIAEAVRPVDWILPSDLAEEFKKNGIAVAYDGNGKCEGPVSVVTSMYGSIVKFSPKGGMVDFLNPPNWAGFVSGEPYEGEPKLAPDLPNVDADWYWGGRFKAKLRGAEWAVPGFGHAGFYRCNCESVTFDVDEFGRTFFPDPLTFKVNVIDTAGNAITHFGDFGNENCMGPESPVVDAQTNKLRPRRADDPKDLKSPFAQPDIGLSWLVGVGVTDHFLYLGDSVNQRLIRVKLLYKADQSCPLK